MEDNTEIKEKESFFSKCTNYIILKLKDRYFLKGLSTLIGASLINFLAGSIFSMCQLVIYEISYIHHFNAKSKISTVKEAFYYPVEVFFQCLASIFSGLLYKMVGLHYTNLIGVGILCIGYLIIFLSNSFTFDMFGMIFGGIGTGIIYYPSTANACEWFMDNNGIVIGIIETMISLGSFFFNLIGEKVINPKQERSEEKSKLYSREIGKNFKTFTLYLLTFSIILYILSTLLMFTKRKNSSKQININLLLSDDNENENENENKKESDEVKKSSENDEINQLDFIKRNINIKNVYIELKNMVNKAMKSKKFIIFLFIAVLESPVPSMIFALYREMGENEKIQQLFLISIGPINFIFECVGGFAFGVLCDYVKKQYLLLFILGFNALTSFIYCVTFKNDITFFLATNFVSFTSGGFYSVKDCFILGVFGVEIYVELIALVNFCVALIIIGLTPLASILDDKKKQAGYWTIFSILGILTLIGFVLCFYVKENIYTFDKIIDYDDENNDNNDNDKDNDNDNDKDNKKDSTNEEKKDEEQTLH